ncbi:MAG: 5-oxoprolinase [Pelagibacterales bacterium]|nr:5-oxoprolinase [Pelagibacterales bacterium]
MKKKWNFMLDQGGTFTDVIAIRPDGKMITKKILSREKAYNYNPIRHGIQLILKENKSFQSYPISRINIGTTVGTNALLERKGDKVLFCVTKGFKDNFVIGNQKRDNLFSRHHLRNKPLYYKIEEIDERISKNGKIIKKLDYNEVYYLLKKNFTKGIQSLSITLINSFKFPKHEKTIKKIAEDIGYKYISCSYDICPMINYTSRGYTTTADNYLTPVIKNFTSKISELFSSSNINYMQSSGFLSNKKNFSGKTSILSGPAGGVNAGIYLAKLNNIRKVIGFDMGGTSTDVWHFAGEVEKRLETKISGIYLKSPVLKIDSIASGGGSIINYQQKRFTVGPDSAGAFPGPACYRNNGPLTITDCNLILGRIIPDFFPKYFGKNKSQKISRGFAKKKLLILLKKVQKDYPLIKNIQQLAKAFLDVAVESMSSTIKKNSTHKGFDLHNYSLLVLGSASGQLACKVAEKLKIKKIIFHPLSGFLSAFGAGLSSHGETFEASCEKILNKKNLQSAIDNMKNNIKKKYFKSRLVYYIRLKYFGSNTVISLPLKKMDILELKSLFNKKHLKTYGFNYNKKDIFIDSIETEAILKNSFNFKFIPDSINEIYKKNITNYEKNFFYENKFVSIKYINSNSFKTKKSFKGPVLFNDFNTTLVVEKNWKITRKKNGSYEIVRSYNKSLKGKSTMNIDSPSPEKLEIFNNLFFSIAEQMGEVLKNTAQSVNVKERMDFSCALFNHNGDLIANAPHIPIHLGAMSETVKYLIDKHKLKLLKGETLLHNDPYSGGTHLPDLTVITPFLNKRKNKILFLFANRAHHSDIGGITPGSMPAFSKSIYEEGILFNGFSVLQKNKVLDNKILKEFKKGRFPSRDPIQNLNDIKAQIAACKKGILEMEKIISSYSLDTVNQYVSFINKNCTEVIDKIIKKIPNSKFSCKLDNGSIIQLKINFNKKIKKLEIDFSGSSRLLDNNFNTPRAVTKSVVIYFLRTLVKDNMPLNEGALKNINLIFSKDSMLNPIHPAPVVAGNVETSQTLIDILNGAISIQAACYGTMSNITFGDKNFGYYETICGGEGASEGNNGTDAVHCHMTNTSITDAEILEWNYPVRLLNFSIRRGSGGQGKWTGGNGSKREIEFLKDLDLTILSNRRKIAPFGLKGGKKGKKGENYIKKNKSLITLPSSCQIKVKKGQSVIIYTPGGGGFK